MKNLANYNSPENIGSTHWFRTLVSNAKHMGEFMKSNYLGVQNNSELIKLYGEQIVNIMSDLIEWQETHQPLIQNLNEK